MSNDPWDDLPQGEFWKWGDEPGKELVGDVISRGIGQDFNGNDCPQLEILLDDGERTSLTAGQAQLKAKLLEERPNPGDRIRIVWTKSEKRDKGELKHFDVTIKRGGAKQAVSEEAASQQGARGEREAAEMCTELFGVPVRRQLGAGRADDVGDLDGVEGLCIQVATSKNIGQVVRHKTLEAEVQQENRGTPFGCTLSAISTRPPPVDLTPTDDIDWSQASCRGGGTARWYSKATEVALRAIAICSTCPIRPECRDYGIANENHGIWGGYPVDPVVRRAIFVRYRWKVATVRRTILAAVEKYARESYDAGYEAGVESMSDDMLKLKQEHEDELAAESIPEPIRQELVELWRRGIPDRTRFSTEDERIYVELIGFIRRFETEAKARAFIAKELARVERPLRTKVPHELWAEHRYAQDLAALHQQYAEQTWGKTHQTVEGFVDGTIPNAATTDADTHRRWWAGVYQGCGIGIATGPESGIWVLDVDPAEGGLDRLRELRDEFGPLPDDGPRANTAGGGFHLFFRYPGHGKVATTKRLADTGLDVRGQGGQVAAPPTPHPTLGCKMCRAEIDHDDTKPYSWHRDPYRHELPDAPEWLLDLVVVERQEQPAPPAPAPTAEIEGTESAAAAITAEHDWHTLLTADGWSFAGNADNGDTHWTRPGKDARAGVSAILHEPEGPFVNYSTNATGLCQPWAATPKGDGWSYSLYGYIAATQYGGDRSAPAREWRRDRQRQQMDDWATAPAEQIVPTTEDGELDLSFANLIDWPTFWDDDHSVEDWLVWPLVPRARGVSLFAEAKQGKSTIALAILAAAATGRPILGTWEIPEPISILYLDYEMTDDDLWERLDSLGYSADDMLGRLHYALLPILPPLDTAAGAERLMALVRHLGVDLVVIDTFGRAVAGEENDADTYRAFYRHTGMALKAEGVAMLRTDHAGKEADKGQRGSSAKNDDVDLVWSLARSDLGVTITRTHSRIGWAPEKVEIERLADDDGATYRLSRRRSWPEGTRDAAELLERMGVPLTASAREASIAMREALGEKPPEGMARQAQDYRRAMGLGDWASS
eukprot:g14895.t1